MELILVKCPSCHKERFVGTNIIMPICRACQIIMEELPVTKNVPGGDFYFATALDLDRWERWNLEESALKWRRIVQFLDNIEFKDDREKKK